jgi:hypothetical protein
MAQPPRRQPEYEWARYLDNIDYLVLQGFSSPKLSNLIVLGKNYIAVAS